jgi:glycerol-3-phosphate cytidylyltransferase-like family protein
MSSSLMSEGDRSQMLLHCRHVDRVLGARTAANDSEVLTDTRALRGFGALTP